MFSKTTSSIAVVVSTMALLVIIACAPTAPSGPAPVAQDGNGLPPGQAKVRHRINHPSWFCP